jgi:hypothetical protein
MTVEKKRSDPVLHCGVPVKAVYGPDDLRGFDPMFE